MKLRLYRTRTRQITADGVLMTENGTRICDTAEHTPSMLPPGTYLVKMKKHRRFGHRSLKLMRRATKSGWIVPGNGAYGKSTSSNIIVGTHLVPGVVTHSRPCFDRLVKRMERLFKRHRDVTLIIR